MGTFIFPLKFILTIVIGVINQLSYLGGLTLYDIEILYFSIKIYIELVYFSIKMVGKSRWPALGLAFWCLLPDRRCWRTLFFLWRAMGGESMGIPGEEAFFGGMSWLNLTLLAIISIRFWKFHCGCEECGCGRYHTRSMPEFLGTASFIFRCNSYEIPGFRAFPSPSCLSGPVSHDRHHDHDSSASDPSHFHCSLKWVCLETRCEHDEHSSNFESGRRERELPWSTRRELCRSLPIPLVAKTSWGKPWLQVQVAQNLIKDLDPNYARLYHGITAPVRSWGKALNRKHCAGKASQRWSSCPPLIEASGWCLSHESPVFLLVMFESFKAQFHGTLTAESGTRLEPKNIID